MVMMAATLGLSQVHPVLSQQLQQRPSKKDDSQPSYPGYPVYGQEQQQPAQKDDSHHGGGHWFQVQI